MKLNEAIEVLKDLKRLSTIPMTLREGIDTILLNEAIDTVVEHCEQKTYTAKDMADFAKWCLLDDGSMVVNMDDKEMEDNLKLWEETK